MVDGGVEAVVMGAEGLQYLPHDPVFIVVLESLLRRLIGGNADGEDDVSIPLSFGPAHDSPDGLDNVDDAVARVEEEHRVESGHVDAFGETAGVGEDAAGVGGGFGLEPIE